MIINHNLPAMNAHRQMGINNSSLSKSLEKLSSGLAINRASDNAAGLAISEKMRGQISGLNQASTNAQDGISLIQTAEGALNETHSILQRMRELSVQSANGTYQDDVDRENIQKEVDALKSEIDRISSSTHYNNIKLLDGSLAGSDVISGISSNKIDGVAYTATSAVVVPGAAPVATDTISSVKISYTDADGVAKTYVFAGTGAAGGGTAAADFANAAAKTIKDVAGEYTSNKSNAIANADEFNSLFDVSVSGGALKFTAKSGEAQTITNVEVLTSGDAAMAAAAPATTTAKVDAKLEVTLKDTTEDTLANAKFAAGSVLEIGGSKIYFMDSKNDNTELRSAKDGYVNIDLSTVDGSIGGTAGALTVNGALAAIDKAVDNAAGATAGDFQFVLADEATGVAAKITISGKDFENAPAFTLNGKSITGTTDGTKATATTGVTFQIGANGTADQRVTLQVKSQSSAGLGVNKVDVSKQDTANSAIASIDSAINSVSGTRADLGALQNRMEHTINSLGVASENLTAAESRIRDVDMAKEMMNFTKTQILSQASQAMLAQANTLPQGVLQLLQ